MLDMPGGGSLVTWRCVAERGCGGVLGGATRARGIGRRRRRAVGGGLRRARSRGAGARGARAAGSRRRAAGRARACAAADVGAVPARAPRAALQGIGARALPAHPRVPRLARAAGSVGASGWLDSRMESIYSFSVDNDTSSLRSLFDGASRLRYVTH